MQPHKPTLRSRWYGLPLLWCLAGLLPAAELPLEVQLDLIERRIFQYLNNQEAAEALAQIDAYRSLAELPPLLSFYEAQIAAATDDAMRAEAALQRYFAALGGQAGQDANYAQALELYDRMQPLAEQQRAAAAELARIAQEREAMLAREAALERKRELVAELDERGAIWDCEDCPVLASIPAGEFQMGARRGNKDAGSTNRPQRRVRVPAFTLGVFEVTMGDFAAFVQASGYAASSEWRNPGFTQGMDHPVVNISWNDAQAYVTWLKEHTGKPYRLPSEAEWEYAARAGSSTAYLWGDEIGNNLANCSNSSCRDQWSNTAPVGSFAPNAFGLYDMHGNVWEWVSDCWNDSYRRAPSDGSAWMAGNCESAVLRGGSWYNVPAVLFSALRNVNNRTYRGNGVGVRIAQDLSAE